MSKNNLLSLILIVLLVSSLIGGCGATDELEHRASAEIKGSHEGELLDYEESLHVFERVQYYELGENASKVEDIEVAWNKNARFISDELAEMILLQEKIQLVEPELGNRVILIEVDESEAIYKPEEMLVHIEKKVTYWVVDKEHVSSAVTYVLGRAHLEEVFDVFNIPEQTVYFNHDNLAYVAEGVELVSGSNTQSSSTFTSPFDAGTVYAADNNHVYSVDLEYLDGQITVHGEIRLYLPKAHVRYKAGLKNYEDDFDISFTAGEEFELEINAGIEYQEVIMQKLWTYGLDIGNVGQGSFSIYIVIDIEGNISFVYKIEQSCHIVAGVRGEKGKIFPKIDTIEYYAEVDSSLAIEGEISGDLTLRAGLEAGVYFNIMDYDIVIITALVAVDAKAEFEVQLTEPYDRCFKLTLDAVFESEGLLLYPTVRWEDEITWWMPWTWLPEIETLVYAFDIYKNSWLIYEYERCSEGDGEFATGVQALVPGGNTMRVSSSGDLPVYIVSNSGHRGYTDYLITGITPGTRVQLTAPEYNGYASERTRFVRWDGVVNSTDRSIEFIFDAEDTVDITAYYVSDAIHNLYVRSWHLIDINSSTGHGGTGSYDLSEIAGGTMVTLEAPESFLWDHTLYEFTRWTIAYLGHTPDGQLSNEIIWQSPVTDPSISIIMNQHTFVRAEYTRTNLADLVGSTGPDINITLPSFQKLTVNSSLTGVDISSNTGHGGITNYTIPFISNGKQVHLEAPEIIGPRGIPYRFDRWSGAVESTKRGITLTMNADKTVTAHYVAEPLQPSTDYTLSVSSQGASNVPISSTTGHGGTTNYVKTVGEGGNVNLEALLYVGSGKERKRFSGWSGAVSSTNRGITVVMNANKGVTANYLADPEEIFTYNLSVFSEGGSNVPISSTTGHGGTTSYTVTGIGKDTQVQLEAPLYAGKASFSHWSGAVDSTNRTITFKMDANNTLTAHYRLPYGFAPIDTWPCAILLCNFYMQWSVFPYRAVK